MCRCNTYDSGFFRRCACSILEEHYVSHSSWPACAHVFLRWCECIGPLSLSFLWSLWSSWINVGWMAVVSVIYTCVVAYTRSGIRVAHEIFDLFLPFLWLAVCRFVGCRIDFHKLFGLVIFSLFESKEMGIESKMCRICCVSFMFFLLLTNTGQYGNPLDHLHRYLWMMSIDFIFPAKFCGREKNATIQEVVMSMFRACVCCAWMGRRRWRRRQQRRRRIYQNDDYV